MGELRILPTTAAAARDLLHAVQSDTIADKRAEFDADAATDVAATDRNISATIANSTPAAIGDACAANANVATADGHTSPSLGDSSAVANSGSRRSRH